MKFIQFNFFNHLSSFRQILFFSWFIKTIILLFLVYSLNTKLLAQLRLDYYYDNSGMYTKFSDWIPKRLHKWHPKHVEDFFLLYSLKQHYGEQSLLKNIYFLQTALKRRFRHPRNALVLVETKEQYHKYRLLLFMHIHLKIMRSYLRLGSQFDKRHLYFYNLDFAKELNESFKIARFYYEKSIPYWKESVILAEKASRYSFELKLDTLESIRYDIIRKEINFDEYINNHLSRLKQKQDTVTNFLSKQE